MYNFSDSYLYIQLVCRHFLLLNLMLKGKTIKRFHSYSYFVLLTVYALTKSALRALSTKIENKTLFLSERILNRARAYYENVKILSKLTKCSTTEFRHYKEKTAS
jgi:hypothetical protein